MMSKNKQNVKDKNVSSVVAGVTGAAIGFGIAVAGAAVVLNDKDSRKKVKNALTNIKDQAMSYMQDVQKKTDKKEKEIEGKLASSKKVEVKLTS
jgi:3-hydroxyacyl-CoA dehydrogenase